MRAPWHTRGPVHPGFPGAGRPRVWLPSGCARAPYGSREDGVRGLPAGVASSSALAEGRSARGALSEADRDELLETADESLTALATLITDLLDVSRLEAGVLAVSTTPVETADMVLPALDELGVGPGEVELDLDLTVPSVVADPVLLQRVVVNLLANALRHSPAGRRVRVATSTFAGTVEIRVVDHGPGIPADRREDVFVPFQRLGDTDNTTGLGLGLALSKGFVEGMGGTLAPEDTPGGGLTMVVALPAAGVTRQPDDPDDTDHTDQPEATAP